MSSQKHFAGKRRLALLLAFALLATFVFALNPPVNAEDTIPEQRLDFIASPVIYDPLGQSADNGRYYAATANGDITGYPDSITINNTQDLEIVWLYTHDKIAEMPYLVYEIPEAQADSLVTGQGVAVAKDLAGATTMTYLPQSPGVHVVNIENLIPEGDYPYTCVWINVELGETISFPYIYLTNKPFYVDADEETIDELEEAITAAKLLDISGLAASPAKTAFTEALADAEALLEDFNAMQTAVEAALAALIATIEDIEALLKPEPEPEPNIFRLKATQTAGFGASDGGYYSIAMDVSDFGEAGLKFSGENETSIGWRIPFDVIEQYPYFVFEADSTNGKVIFRIGTQANMQNYYYYYGMSTLGRREIDLREFDVPADDYLLISFFIVLPEGDYDFSSFCLADTIPEKRIVFKDTYDGAALGDGRYFVFDGSTNESVTGVPPTGIAFTGGTVEGIWWPFVNTSIVEMPYLVYEIRAEDVEKLKSDQGIGTTKKSGGSWDDSVTRYLDQSPGVHIVNINKLLAEDDTDGYTYIGLRVIAGETVTFPKLYLTNKPFYVNADVEDLMSAIEAAKLIDISKVKSGSEKDAFIKALTDARTLLKDYNVTQEVVDAVVIALNAATQAVEALLESDPDPDSDSDPVDPPDTSESNTGTWFALVLLTTGLTVVVAMFRKKKKAV